MPILAEVFRSSVLDVVEHYTRQELQHWASFADGPAFHDFINKSSTFVAEINKAATGFAGIESSGHIASVYVGGGWQRKGIGKALMQYLLDWGKVHNVTRFYAEASFLSRGLFEQFGFQVIKVEHSQWKGMMFKRFWVEKIV